MPPGCYRATREFMKLFMPRAGSTRGNSPAGTTRERTSTERNRSSDPRTRRTCGRSELERIFRFSRTFTNPWRGGFGEFKRDGLNRRGCRLCVPRFILRATVRRKFSLILFSLFNLRSIDATIKPAYLVLQRNPIREMN